MQIDFGYSDPLFTPGAADAIGHPPRGSRGRRSGGPHTLVFQAPGSAIVRVAPEGRDRKKESIAPPPLTAGN